MWHAKALWSQLRRNGDKPERSVSSIISTLKSSRNRDTRSLCLVFRFSATWSASPGPKGLPFPPHPIIRSFCTVSRTVCSVALLLHQQIRGKKPKYMVTHNSHDKLIYCTTSSCSCYDLPFTCWAVDSNCFSQKVLPFPDTDSKTTSSAQTVL